jgi:hypothetical protein
MKIKDNKKPSVIAMANIPQTLHSNTDDVIK